MSLSAKARRLLEIALGDDTFAKELGDQIDTNEKSAKKLRSFHRTSDADQVIAFTNQAQTQLNFGNEDVNEGGMVTGTEPWTLTVPADVEGTAMLSVDLNAWLTFQTGGATGIWFEVYFVKNGTEYHLAEPVGDAHVGAKNFSGSNSWYKFGTRGQIPVQAGDVITVIIWSSANGSMTNGGENPLMVGDAQWTDAAMGIAATLEY